jgi:putative ABC transport system permease protein
MPYSLLMLWRDRRRYASAVLAVAFSDLLIAAQCGLLFGIILCGTVPVDGSSADIWITTCDATALTQARPIPRSWVMRAAVLPEVERTEDCQLSLGLFHKPGQGANELCLLVGTRIDDSSLGALVQLSPALRERLREPGAVVVNEWDLPVLGLTAGVDEYVEINERRVRVVGTVRGYQGVNFVWVFCSLSTAKMLHPETGKHDLTSFGLVKCHNPEQAAQVASRLRNTYPEMGVYTRAEFSQRISVYWLFRSKSGTVMLCTVVLALLVGLVVTSQTLYGAVVASQREYAVLDALGIPRGRLVGLVLAQSFWIGLLGVVLALPLVILFGKAAELLHTDVVLPAWLLLVTAAITMLMALLSGVAALRSLRHVAPAQLLR